jgi:hypothetical protein
MGSSRYASAFSLSLFPFASQIEQRLRTIRAKIPQGLKPTRESADCRAEASTQNQGFTAQKNEDQELKTRN